MVGFEWNEAEFREAAFDDGLAAGISQGLSQGISQGKSDAKLEDLHNLIQALSIPAEQAMDLLKVPQGERAGYHQLLGQ